MGGDFNDNLVRPCARDRIRQCALSVTHGVIQRNGFTFVRLSNVTIYLCVSLIESLDKKIVWFLGGVFCPLQDAFLCIFSI